MPSTEFVYEHPETGAVHVLDISYEMQPTYDTTTGLMYEYPEWGRITAEPSLTESEIDRIMEKFGDLIAERLVD